MVFSTAWDAFATGANNVVTTEVSLGTPYACRVTLSPTPGIPTVVTLPTGTLLVRVWTADGAIRFALDTTPDPQGFSSSLSVPSSAFAFGDTILPGLWQSFGVPDDGMIHTANVTSSDEQPSVLFVALVG